MHVVIDRETYEFPAGWSVLDGSMTRRTKDNELRPPDFLDVSPDDAKRLDVHDSDVPQRAYRTASRRDNRYAGVQGDGCPHRASRVTCVRDFPCE
jgi:hypothetical protein